MIRARVCLLLEYTRIRRLPNSVIRLIVAKRRGGVSTDALSPLGEEYQREGHRQTQASSLRPRPFSTVADQPSSALPDFQSFQETIHWVQPSPSYPGRGLFTTRITSPTLLSFITHAALPVLMFTQP